MKRPLIILFALGVLIFSGYEILARSIIAAIESVKIKYGYVNPRGEFVLRPIYDGVEDFSNGQAVICLQKEYALAIIDKQGEIVENIEEYEHPLQCGVRKFYGQSPDGKPSKRLPLGEVTHRRWWRPELDAITNFEHGVAWVQVGNFWGLIDEEGNYIMSPKCVNVRPFSEGLAACGIEIWEGKKGFLYRVFKLYQPFLFPDTNV